MSALKMYSTLVLLGVIILLTLSSLSNTVSAEGETIIHRGENVTITIQLLQNGTYGDPVPGQQIEFFDQTHNMLLGYDITSSSGIASIEWAIPLDFPLGPTLLNATFRGNELLFLLPSAQLVTLNIVSSTHLLVQHEVGLLALGDSLSISAQLLNDANAPITDAIVIALSGNTLLSTSITNATGVATFTLQCNNTWAVLGENTIHIIHELNLLDYYARTEECFTIDIQKIVTQIDIENIPTEIMLGNNTNFQLRLSCSEGGISTELGVFFDETKFGTIFTDAFGFGTLFLTIDSRFMPGICTFDVVYNGSERYTSSIISFELIIVSPALIDIFVPITPIIGNDAEIQFTVLDCFGRPFEGTRISVIDTSNGLNTTLQFMYELLPVTAQFPIFAPLGIHNLLIELGSRFVTNSTYYHTLTVWSASIFVLHECNIFHYASPNQRVTFMVKLIESTGNCSYANFTILINDYSEMSVSTDIDGIALFTINAPQSEGQYNLSFFYAGNILQYELSARYDYQLKVSKQIPVQLELSQIEVLHPLQEITVLLRLRCLNGSLLAGINIKFLWLLSEYYMQSQEEGTLILHLSIPSESGYYTLFYEVDSTDSLLYSTGSVEISILQTDILASQGVGIIGFTVSIIVTLIAAAVPLIRQKYLSK